MMTRRTAIGAGVAFAAVACASSFGAIGPVAYQRRRVRSIDALLIDDNIAMPRQMAAFVETNRRVLPIVGIQLDASGQAGLMRVLAKAQNIVGFSSGATLFCVERIAWDQGFRLMARSQRCASEPEAHACRQDVFAYLCGAHNFSASPALPAGAYRPSRADGMLHSWLMLKSRPQFVQNCRET